MELTTCAVWWAHQDVRVQVLTEISLEVCQSPSVCSPQWFQCPIKWTEPSEKLGLSTPLMGLNISAGSCIFERLQRRAERRRIGLAEQKLRSFQEEVWYLRKYGGWMNMATGSKILKKAHSELSPGIIIFYFFPSLVERKWGWSLTVAQDHSPQTSGTDPPPQIW